MTALSTNWGLSQDESLLALRRVFTFRGDTLLDFALHLRSGADLRRLLRHRRDRLLRRLEGRR
jgi:hypothetical protein